MPRIRSTTRNVMKRAWEISKNAINQHNSNPDRIAQEGASKSILEFFAESLKLAWKEEKLGIKTFKKAAGIPKKVMPRIHQALKQLMQRNPNATRIDMVYTALVARYGQNNVKPEDVERHFQTQLC